MNAPDRIWLHPITDDGFQDVWFADGADGDVEYVPAAALTEALATIARQEAELAAAREEVAQLRALLPERGYGEDDAMYERRLLSIRERTSRRVP